MRVLHTLLILTACILPTLSVSGQGQCGFQIDTSRILANQNLDNFLTELRNDIFVVTNNKKDIPRFLKKQLKCFDHNFRIANPGKPYNAGDAILRNLPKRQLTFLANSKDIFVMRYLKGGFGLSSHVLLVKFDNGKIIDIWKGLCAQDIKTVDELIGYIEMNRGAEGRLNTNIINF